MEDCHYGDNVEHYIDDYIRDNIDNNKASLKVIL